MSATASASVDDAQVVEEHTTEEVALNTQS